MLVVVFYLVSFRYFKKFCSNRIQPGHGYKNSVSFVRYFWFTILNLINDIIIMA